MNKVAYKPVIIGCLATFALTLNGCGGGGGGSSTAIAPPPATRTTTITTESGISQDADFTTSGTTVTSFTDQGVSKTGASASITTYDDDGTIQKIAITTPNGTVTWDENSGDIFDNSDVAVVAASPSGGNIAVIINKKDPKVPWSWQTFGIWETGFDTGVGKAGAISVGTPTTGGDIPTTGTVAFGGVAGGIYVNPAGTQSYITASDMYAVVDFKNRSIALETTGTTTFDPVTSTTTDAAALLDMRGALTYQPGVNSFTGTVAAPTLSGTSTGQFYGPQAAELGGVFSLKGSGLANYEGAYGAKQ